MFLPINYHDDAIQITEQFLCRVRKDYKKKQFECGAAKDTDSVRVVLGCGGSVQHVLMPDQYRTVKVNGPIEGVWKEEILQLLEKCGEIQQMEIKDSRIASGVYATFSNPSDAHNAVASLKPPDHTSIEPWFICKQQQEAVSPFSMVIEWYRRRRAGYAFVSFSCDEDFAIAKECLCTDVEEIYGLKFQPSKDGKSELFVLGAFLMDAESKTIQQSILEAIPGLSAESFTISFGLEKKFETSQRQLSDFKEILEALVIETATPGQYTLHMPMPKPHYATYRAYVNFQSPNEGQATLTALQKKEIHWRPLTVNPKLSTSFRYSPAIYAVIKEPLYVIRQELQSRFGSAVTVTDTRRDRGENVIFEIHSHNFDAFIAAKDALNVVLQPVVVSKPYPAFDEYLQTSACEVELQNIQTSTSTYIYRDLREMNIKVYGAKPQSKKAKKKLNRCLSLLNDVMKCIDVELKGPRIPPGLMKHLVSLFGHDLKGLVNDAKGITAARINPRRHMLTLFASKEGYQSVLQIISTFVANHGPHVQIHCKNDLVTCCACLADVESPNLIFRLEYCGHLYCLDCIQMQVAISTIDREFPVLCAAERCSQPFVWKDFENLSQLHINFSIRFLADASLKCYIGANPKLVRNCPSPDCSSIFNVTERIECFTCSACKATICTKCCVPFHYGATCEMYQRSNIPGTGVGEWMKDNPTRGKHCPNCAVPIEKYEGCNNVKCTSCHAHICWVCQAYFSSEQDCYAHLKYAHGSFV